MKALLTLIFVFALASHNGFTQTSVAIPNIFTPNNDGVNDVFRISTSGYTALTCSILNRNGEIVYRFYGLNGSWDGFSHAGVKVSSGVYFISLELVLPDGSVEKRQGTLQVHY